MRTAPQWAASAVVLLVATSPSMAQELSAAATPSDLAAGIARTMAATTPVAPNAPISQQFEAHGVVVEWRTQIKTSTDYEHMALGRAQTQSAITRYMCQPARLTYIRRGVVFHETYSGPNVGEAFDFTVNAAACAALAKPAIADAATQASLASEVARELGSQIDPERTTNGVRIEKPIARGGVVTLVNIVVADASADSYRAKSADIRGRSQGWLCNKFGDALQRGVIVHIFYKSSDGKPLFEFVADSSVC